MAIADAYATIAEYKDQLLKTTADDDDEITVDLLAVSRWIERHLGRFFNKDAGDVTRIYVVGRQGGEPYGGYRHLWIDDLSAAPTTIKIDTDDDGSYADETALPTADFEMFPLNALVGPEAQPYRRIDLTNWGDQVSFPRDLHVEVVGKWGWPAVPSAIKQATIMFTSIHRQESPLATKRIQDDIGSSIEASPQARSLLSGLATVYRRTDW